MKRISIVVVAAALLVVAGLGLPIREMAESMFGWIQENPNVSWLVFLGLYILATVLLLPGSVLTIGGGLAIRFYGRPVSRVSIEYGSRELLVLNWALFSQSMGGREDF